MVEQDKYCIDILTQVSAVSQAMQSVALRLLEGHLRHCVLDAARARSPERETKQGNVERNRPARPQHECRSNR